MGSQEELTAAEHRVRENEEAIAQLRRELEGTTTAEAKADLRRLEEEQGRLVEMRNALFREVAGNDY